MRIGLIGAMDEEVAILKESLKNREDFSIAGCEFSKGSFGIIEVILLKSGIGKVNASIGTSLLNDRFQPDYIINTGSAGGFLQSLNVGDVVISTEVKHHDVDVTAFGYEYGQVPGLPASFMASDMLVDIAERSIHGISDIQAVKGLIATGDSFMNDPERVEVIREQFDGLCAVEMEAAAIAQVCHQFHVPFVIIRALSDIAGKDSSTSFDQFLEVASKNSATLILNMLRELEKHA